MLSEQQQRILGYFIEEAKDHLNTIEQGLLNLQATIEDSEMVSEVFRAAHSVKGGAAMLGLDSIQNTSHRLEDYFKVLKECPVQVDQTLETLLLGVFDALRELLDHLQGPFGLTDDKSAEVMAGVEPIFGQINEHLSRLVAQSGGTPPEDVELAVPAAKATPAPAPQPAIAEESALLLMFQSDVPARLREMLQLFKQADSDATRQQLQSLCRTLSGYGDPFDLPAWAELLSLAERAIAHPDNEFRTLAPVIIKDIKQAQERVLASRAADITPSKALLQLQPSGDDLLLEPVADWLSVPSTTDGGVDDAGFGLPDAEVLDTPNTPLDFDPLNFDAAFGAAADEQAVSGDRTHDFERSFDTADFDLPDTSASDAPGPFASTDDSALGLDVLDGPSGLEELDFAAADDPTGDDQNGPEVGIAELNSLADLFENEAPDLGIVWQEEILSEIEVELPEPLEPDPTSDFSDLLFGQDTAGELSDLELELEGGLESYGTGDDSGSFESAADDSDDDLSAILNAAANSAAQLDDSSEVLFGAQPEPQLPAPDLFAMPDPSAMAEEASLDDLLDGDLFAEESSASSFSGFDDLDTGLLDGLNEGPDNRFLDLPGTSDPDQQLDALDDFFADLGSDLEPEALTSMGEEAVAEVDSSILFEPSAAEMGENAPEDGSLDQPPAAEDLLAMDGSGASNLDMGLELEENPQEDATAQPTSWLDALDSEDGLAALTPAPAMWDVEADQDVTADLWDSEPSAQSIWDSLDDLEEEAPETSPAINPTADPDLLGVEDLGGFDLSDADVDRLEEPTASADLDATEDVAGPEDEFALLDLGLDEALGTEALDGDELFSGVDAEAAGSLDALLEESQLEKTQLEALQELQTSAELAAELAIEESIDDAASASAEEPPVEELSVEEPLISSKPLEAIAPNPEAAAAVADFGDLDLLLGNADETVPPDFGLDLSEASLFENASDPNSDFADLEDLLADSSPVNGDGVGDEADAFADLDALLEEEMATTDSKTPISGFGVEEADDFADLEALLDRDVTSVPPTAPPIPSEAEADEFEDLERLLENADQTLSDIPTMRAARNAAAARRPATRRSAPTLTDQTMRVSVKNLDNLNNLVGELVVNRNSLEQAEERLRQFLDNLLYQVQQLSDVGQRMRDLYERSLLESSLLSGRKTSAFTAPGSAPSSSQSNHATGVSFDALEMDRFTGFHTLSQEMIELIVRVRESASDIDFVVDETDQITRNFRQITTQLQEGLTRTRMVPFAQTADRLPRAVRDISLRCGKQAELVLEGRETLIDKMILEQLYDPMTHLVNNAITHGIESPQERAAMGKAPTGRITVRTFHQGNQTVISVSDDGAGIDPELVKQKAIARGLITPAEAKNMSRLDVYDLLFHHGFSTRDKADDLAGRGVGMDVVRTSLNEIRGVINIDSSVGRGTTFTIRLPLTLSISKALCCISNRARIAFPMDGVQDMLDVPRDRIQINSEGQSCIPWREQLLPFQPLSNLLKYNRSLGRGSVYGGNQEDDIVSVVVLRSNAGSYLALQVDQVLGEQEIVIKQLEGPVPKPLGIAGATVLGDGRIMPIADVLELIDLSMGRIRREAGSSLWEVSEEPPADAADAKQEPTVLIVDDSITVRELLSMTFAKIGYRVEQARDGQEAWEKLRSGLPCDLVFCDIEMPRMDGLELLSRMQKDVHLAHIPIAMLTSRGADRHRQMAIQLGAKGYFTKPYLEEMLLDAAQRMLKGEVLVAASGDSN
ncbi:response regulator [Leptolyngbya sp. O-77]|uniref:response regulator n=1 Tax=Leptolyngbya sp. O-77 TaxID=1080068 RepID=UPI00074D409C|nr:response regulator [Leptolyngbya sp. O-77]BAU40886.1 Gliding motility regulatory protein [Leptolyngbya sp. O-77]